MNEAQAKKVFLKQAKPFFKRYEAERTRKNKRQARTLNFKACITPSPAPFFMAEHEDLMRGKMSMRVPILFSLPAGLVGGYKFDSEDTFNYFKEFCEEK